MYVCSLEKIISEAQQVEAETCGSLLGDDLDLQRCSEQKIQELVGEQKCHLLYCDVDIKT